MNQTADIDNISGKACFSLLSDTQLQVVENRTTEGEELKPGEHQAQLRIRSRSHNTTILGSAGPSFSRGALTSLSFSPQGINYYVITHYDYYRPLSQFGFAAAAIFSFSPSRTL